MSGLNFEQSVELENVSNLMENLGEPSPVETRHAWADSAPPDSINMEESFAAMASIRSSRRRTKGTAVVSINTDSIQKYLDKSKDVLETERPATAPVSSNIQTKSPTKDSLKKSVVSSLNRKIMDKSLDVSKLSSTPSPKTPDSPPKEVIRRRPSEDLCARRLQKWWTSLAIFRKAQFTQFHKWSIVQSQKVFALFLGYRVRRLLRSSTDVKNLRTVIQDVYQTLVDLLQLPAQTSKQNIVSKGTMEKIEAFMMEIKQDTYHNNCRAGVSISETELSMVKSMIKQLGTEKEKFHSLLFAKAHWMSFPSPGYWDLSDSIKAIIIRHRNVQLKQQQHGRVGVSPARSIRTPNHDTLITPPNFRRVVNNSKGSNSGSKLPPSALKLKQHNDIETLEEVDERDAALSNELRVLRAHPLGEGVLKTPQPLPDLMSVRERPITGSGSRGIDMEDHHHHRATSAVDYHGVTPTAASLDVNHKRSSSSGAAIARPVTAPPKSTTKSVRLRHGDKPHLQLDVISADKLMQAKKGKLAKDANTGEAIPDRIPCLKITLLLPPWSGGNSPPHPGSEMKKVAHAIRDFDVVTLNPQWNTTFILNLPCTRAMLKSLIPSAEGEVEDIMDQLTQAEYDRMCEELLLWYSYGILNIEVKDGERFNEEIFLGHANIMLSGLTRSIKKHDFNNLEIAGNFQLEKQKPSQRVSGSIKIHAYLHAPERIFLQETLHVSPTNRRSVHRNITSSDHEVAAAAANATARLKSISRKLKNGLFSNNNSNNNMNEDDSDSDFRESPRFASPPTTSAHQSKVAIPSTVINNAPAYSSHFMKSLAGKQSQVSAPQLEESVNVKYAVSGTSKVLKKLPPDQRNVDAVVKAATRDQQHVKAEADKRKAAPVFVQSQVSSYNMNNVNDSVSIGGGARRSMFIQDITKQLDVLSSVQQSTDTVLGQFNKRLNEKRTNKASGGSSGAGNSSMNDYSVNDESAEISGMMVNNYMTYNQHHSPADDTLEEGDNESVGSTDEEKQLYSHNHPSQHSRHYKEKVEIDLQVTHRMNHSNSASLIEEDDRPEMAEDIIEATAGRDNEETASNYSFQDEVIEHTDEGEADSEVEDADWQDVSNELQDIVNDCLPHKTLHQHPLVQAGAEVTLSIVHNNDISYAIDDYYADQLSIHSIQNNTTDESHLTGLGGDDDSELMVVRKR